jgi:DNA-directed RNA polymerase subunit RPC12/RpoP
MSAKFPCAVCAAPLEVRETKKGKPYVICDPCGMQMFVRNSDGIRRFEVLVAEADEADIWTRLERLERRYQKTCPECGHKFLADERLIETSIMNGSLKGYRCPRSGCGGIAKREVAKK